MNPQLQPNNINLFQGVYTHPQAIENIDAFRQAFTAAGLQNIPDYRDLHDAARLPSTPTPHYLQQLVEKVSCRYWLEKWTNYRQWKKHHWRNLPAIGRYTWTGKYFELLDFTNYQAAALLEWMVFQRDSGNAENRFVAFVQTTGEPIPEKLAPLIDFFYPHLFDREILP